MIVFLATTGAIIGLGIAGVYYSSNTNYNYRKLKCSLLLFINEALSGASDKYSPSSTWIGVDKAYDKGEKAIEQVESLDMNELSDISEHDLSRAPVYTKSLDKIDRLKDEYKSRVVRNPTSTNPSDISLSILEKDEVFEALKQQIEEYEIYHASLGSVQSSTGAAASDGLIETAKTSLALVKDFTDSIGGYKKDIKDVLDKVDTPIKIAHISVTAYYGVIIGCASITILGSIFLAFCKCNGGRCVSNLGCFILTILMILGFLIAAILMPASVILIDLCNLIDIKNLENDHSFIPDSAWDELSTCLIGDGSLYEKNNLQESLGFIEDLNAGFNNFTLIYDDSDTSLSCKVRYNTTKNLIDKLKRIIETTPQEAAPELFTELDLSSLANAKDDKVVWHKSECGSSPLLTKDNYDSDLPNGACFPITSMNDACDNYINARYRNDFIALKRLCYYSKDVTTVLTDLIDEIKRTPGGSTFLDLMDQDNSHSGVCYMVDKISEYNVEVNELIASFGVLDNELKDDLNCDFLKANFIRVHDSVCGSFTQSFTFIGLTIGIISAITFISTGMLICVNRRYYARKVKKQQ